MGAGLWTVVAAASLLLWQAERAERLAAEQKRKAALADAVPDPTTAATINVPMYAANANEQVININLSDLVSQGTSAPPGPAWDPNGVADFSFTNCDGRTITKADLLGKPWACCFVFTHCVGPCPTVTRQFKLLQDWTKHYDIQLVTLTVDPARDTPEVLLNYAKQTGADLSRWYFLTGNQAEIYGLIEGSFRMPVREQTGPDRREGYEVLHSTNVMLVDAQGVVVGKFNAKDDTEIASLRHQLQDLAARMPPTTVDPPIASAGAGQ